MIDTLVKMLQSASKAYYEGNQIMSDAEFDALEEKLRKLDPMNPWFETVREARASFYGTKRPHLYKFIGSVEKIHAVSESKLKGEHMTASAKLDGTSMTVYFRNGKLDYALTRGTGFEGFDITDKYLAITEKYNIKVPAGLTIAIRGEVVMGNASWEKYKAGHPDAAMQRNTGTGLVNRKDVSEDLKYLDFVIYEIVATSDVEFLLKSRSELEALEAYDFGFPIAPFIVTNGLPSDEDLKTLKTEFQKKFPIDGIVFNDFLSLESNNAGCYNICSSKEAYKFEDDAIATTVEKIEWTLQKSGKLMPVVVVEPVDVEGATVRRATGFNAKFIEINRIGPGSTITITRANLVIPDIREILTESEQFSLPEVCPHCGVKLQWKGVHLSCENELCPKKQRLLVDHFLRVCGGDVKGASDVIYGQLNRGLYNETLFYMKNTNYSEFTEHQRKLIKRIYDNIFNGISYDTLLKGVALEGIGDKNIKQICRDREAVERYFNGDEPNWKIKLTPSVLESLAEGQNRAAHLKSELDWAFIPVGWKDDAKSESDEDTSNFRIYAVTSTLSVPRKAFESLLKTHGWIQGTIKKAECLITNDPYSGSSKNKEAQALGKRVISEEQFRKEFL